MLLLWGNLVLKKESIHNSARLVYHGYKKLFINCIYNEDFKLFFIIFLRFIFLKQTSKQHEYRKDRSHSGIFLFILFFFFPKDQSKKTQQQQIRARDCKSCSSFQLSF